MTVKLTMADSAPLYHLCLRITAEVVVEGDEVGRLHYHVSVAGKSGLVYTPNLYLDNVLFVILSELTLQ